MPKPLIARAFPVLVAVLLSLVPATADEGPAKPKPLADDQAADRVLWGLPD